MIFILVVSSLVAGVVIAALIEMRVLTLHQRTTNAFLVSHSMTNSTYNGAGCAADALTRAYRKSGDSNPAHWAILADRSDFSLAVFGGYPRNAAGFPTFCGVEILLYTIRSFHPNDLGLAVSINDPRVLLARKNTLAYFAKEEKEQADHLALIAKQEAHTVQLLERALRNVATEPSIAGALVAAALA
jgi:hypothetical protein